MGSSQQDWQEMDKARNRSAGYLKIADGTQWPDTNSDIYKEIAYKLLHGGELTDWERAYAGGVMESLSTLINHPAFTLKKVAGKVSMIRNEVQ